MDEAVTTSPRRIDAKYDQGEAYEISTVDGNIVAFVNRPKGASRGNVVIVPPYAMSAHGYFLFQDYLTWNGFTVYRFDGINNVGLSSGEVINYTLGQAWRDLGYVIEAFFPTSSSDSLVLLSQSLSFPIAVRRARRDERVKAVVSLLGAVSVRDTVERVLKSSLEPYFSDLPDAAPRQRIFGHEVNAMQFVASMIDEGYVDANDVYADVNMLTQPLYLVSSEADEYVDFRDVLALRSDAEKNGAFVALADMGHMIGRSVESAKLLARLSVELTLKAYGIAEQLESPILTESIERASYESAQITMLGKNRPSGAAWETGLSFERGV